MNIYNDNEVVVKWSRNQTTKGLHHIQIRENIIREQYQLGQINVLHIAGKINPSDMFTKEEKSTEHFQETRDSIMITEEIFDTQNNQTLPPHHKQRITTENA